MATPQTNADSRHDEHHQRCRFGDGGICVDFDDIDEIAQLLEQQGMSNVLAAIEAALAAVPEPGTAVLLTSATLWLNTRRRRGRYLGAIFADLSAQEGVLRSA